MVHPLSLSVSESWSRVEQSRVQWAFRLFHVLTFQNLYLRYVFQLAGTQTQKNPPAFHVFKPINNPIRNPCMLHPLSLSVSESWRVEQSRVQGVFRLFHVLKFHNLYLRYVFQLAGKQTQKNPPVFHVLTPKKTLFTMAFPPCRPKSMIFTMFSLSNQHNNPTCFTSSHSKTRYLRRFCYFPAH